MVATVIQSLSGFADTASVQMCLGLCGTAQLQQIFAVPLSLTKVAEKDVVTYVYGLYSTVQDFAHLVPSLTMALGVAAVPALSGAYQDQSARFGSLYAGILKYSVILGAAGSGGLALFSYEVLSLFYGTSSPDLVLGCHQLLFWFAFTALPAALSSTCVFALQALGYAKRLLLPFSLTAVLRVGLNFLLIPNGRFHLYGSCRFIFVSFRLLFGADAWDHQGQILPDRGVRKADTGGDYYMSDGERCGRCVLYPAAKYLEFCLIRGFIFGSSNNFVAALWYTFHKRSAFCRRKVKKTAWLLEISRCIIYNFLERVDQKRRRYGIGFYTQRAL